MTRILSVLLVALLTLSSGPALAQTIAPVQRCEGPADLCQKVSELQSAIEAQKKAAAVEKAKEQGDIAKAKAEEKAKDDQEKAERMAKLVAGAAVMAVALRTLLLSLQSWKSFFTTDKGKAWLKVITLCVGFVAFILTNIGFGIPWWQALVIAGGGPGAILVHELMKLIPVLKGTKKYAEVEPQDSDPPQDSPPKA